MGYEVYIIGNPFEKINTKQELFDLAKKYDLIIKLNFYQGSIENGTSESVIIRLYDNYPNSINIWSKQIFYNTKDYRVQNIDGVKMLVKYNTNNWK